jgi:GWxTD domain-containing protein
VRPSAWLCLIGISLAPSASAPRAAQVDSTVPLERLRAVARAFPDSFPPVFAYARAVARAANERPGDWRPRAEARNALDAAYRLRPEDPRVLVEMGLLMRKQGFRVDGRRVLERAERLAAARAELLAPPERAELHLQLGLIYEVWWEDAENLGILPANFVVGSCPHIYNYYPPGVVVPTSPQSNLLVYNVVCPDVFDELMGYWYAPEGQYEVEYVTMLRHFQASAAADPTDQRAALRLLRHLAAAGRWEEYLAAAEPLARRLPTDPYALMFLGLGLHHTGWRERADSAFTLAIEHADPELRRDMLRPEQLLRRQDSTSFEHLAADRREALADVFWRARDPLFLSPENERLAEHLARLAYVEVAYSQPQSEVRGRWSERGGAWLRWGRPLQIRAIRQGEVGILEFWDYGRGSPDLVFHRQRTYRRARQEELSAEYVRWARDRVPEIFLPAYPRIVSDIPFQAAAFRDTAGGALLEVYAAVPGTVLQREAHLAELETGVFVVTGDYWEPRAADRRRLANGGADTPLDVAFALAPGPYVVSVEALAGNVAAQQRERVDVPAFADTLMLSDLLLVDRFGVDTTHVDDRAALVPMVSRSLRFPAGAPIGVLWEIYGLATDSTGTARYHVRAGVADAEQRDALVRLLRGLVGRDVSPSGIEWDVSRVPRADGAIVEFVTLELPDAAPGSYRLFITVTDRVTGRTYTAHRVLAVTSP